jgi:hypothetical protein
VTKKKKHRILRGWKKIKYTEKKKEKAKGR